MKKLVRSLPFLLAALALVLGTFPVAARPAEQVGFGLKPADVTKGYFIFQAQPGDVIEDAFVAINNTGKPLVLEITPVDGHTALTGGVSFPNEGNVGPATWIDLPGAGTVEVPHEEGKGVQMNFKVTIPEGTPPGEYVAGFLARPADLSQLEEYDAETGEEVKEGSGGFKVQVVPQMGLTMIITVGQPDTCKVAIHSVDKEIRNAKWNLAIQTENQGNIHFSGDGKLTLTSKATGEKVIDTDYKIGYFVIGDTIGYPLVTDAPAPGDYRLEITVTDKNDPACTTTYVEDVTFTDEEAERAAQQERERAEAEARRNGTYVPDYTNLIITIAVALGGLILVLFFIILIIILKRRKKEEEKQEDQV